MLQITKGLTLQEAQIPFAWVEVRYPDKDRWDEAGFYAMVDEHLAALCGRYRDYVRADVFGQNPYFRFFRKFKKTFPVMMQFESVLLKGREFPKSNAVTAVPFLAELETHVLTGTYDVEQLLGPAELYLAQAKEPFAGLRGDLVHTHRRSLRPRRGRHHLSMIAGADARTCARQTSRHVFYSVFGVPGQDPAALRPMQERLAEYARILAPDAEVSCQTI
ncbi:MAG: hypothetical protein ACLT1T_04295 [Oscillospiraceae bacterium]